MPVPAHPFEPSPDQPHACGAVVRDGQTCGFPASNSSVHAPGALPIQPARPQLRLVEPPPPAVALDAPETSKRAAEDIRPARGRIVWDVLALAAHPIGVTDYEAEQELEQSHQTVSSARNGLMRRGYVEALVIDGEPVTRPTRRSRAQVWAITPAGHEALAEVRQPVGA